MSALGKLIDLAPERTRSVTVCAGGETLSYELPTTYDEFLTVQRQASAWARGYIEGTIFPPALYEGQELATSEDVLASCWMLASMDADPANTVWLYSRLAAVHWEVFGQILSEVVGEISVSTVEVERIRIDGAKKNCSGTGCEDGDCRSPETCTESITTNSA